MLQVHCGTSLNIMTGDRTILFMHHTSLNSNTNTVEMKINTNGVFDVYKTLVSACLQAFDVGTEQC